MKLRTTKKAIKANYSNMLKVGYCDLQNLLYGQEPFGYSTRAEGWACDYYDIDGVCISTGYAPTGATVDYKLVRKFNELARAVRDNNALGYEQKQTELDKLRSEFIREAIK